MDKKDNKIIKMPTKMTIILIIIFGLITTLIGLIFYFDILSKPIYLKAFGAIIVLLGTGIGIFGNFSHDKNSSDKSSKILNNSDTINQKSDTLITIGHNTNDKVQLLEQQNINLLTANNSLISQINNLQLANNEQVKELNILREENKILTEQIINTKTEILHNYIGGNNFGMIEVSGILCDNDFCYQLMFANQSKSPLYDVVINYYNPEDYEKTRRNGMATVEGLKLYKNVNIGNVIPQRHIPIGEPFKIEQGKFIHLVFYIGARNGIYYQELFCYPKTPNIQNWNIATRIFKYNDANSKYEKIKSWISPNFPISEQNIIWQLKM